MGSISYRHSLPPSKVRGKKRTPASVSNKSKPVKKEQESEDEIMMDASPVKRGKPPIKEDPESDYVPEPTP